MPTPPPNAPPRSTPTTPPATGNPGADTAREMRSLLSETLHDAGVAALIATHDRREALHLADRIVELGGSPTTVVRNRQSPLDRHARRDMVQVEAALSRLF